MEDKNFCKSELEMCRILRDIHADYSIKLIRGFLIGSFLEKEKVEEEIEKYRSGIEQLSDQKLVEQYGKR